MHLCNVCLSVRLVCQVAKTKGMKNQSRFSYTFSPDDTCHKDTDLNIASISVSLSVCVSHTPAKRADSGFCGISESLFVIFALVKHLVPAEQLGLMEMRGRESLAKPAVRIS